MKQSIALVAAVNAVKLQREPLLSAGAPAREVFMIPYEKDHPMDYKVADFGIDHDTKISLNNTKNTELKLKHNLNFMNDPVPLPIDDFPQGYKVADFGQDPEITTSLNNMANAQSDLGIKFSVTKESVPEFAPNWTLLQTESSINREPLLSNNRRLEVHQNDGTPDWPHDYVVPDFGVDHDVKISLNNTKNTELKLKHNLNFMNDPVPLPGGGDDFPMDYKVPYYGVDEDVATTQNNMGNAEQKLGQKMSADFGLKDDGIARGYKVLDLGVSDEILYTQNNLKNSEKALKHKLNVAWDVTDGIDRGYKVLDLGMDHDIKQSLSSLDLEQGIHGRWSLDGFPEPKAEKAEIDGKAPKSSITEAEDNNKELDAAAANAEAAATAIPTDENISELQGHPVATPAVSAGDLTAAIDAAPMSAKEVAESVKSGNGGKKVKHGKGKAKLSPEEKADSVVKNDGDKNEDDSSLAKKLAEQAAERKAEKKAKKAEKKAAKAGGVKKSNTIGSDADAPAATFDFVQLQAPKDAQAPTNQSLSNSSNWDPTRHTWFAQAGKY